MEKWKTIWICAIVSCLICGSCSDKPTTIKVSTFNIWLNTLGGKLPPSQTAKVIAASQTDIVGIQEGQIYVENGIRHDHVPEIADTLDFHLFDQGEGHYILSRYPIVDSTASRYGVKIQTAKGKCCWMFNCHLNYIPYQPYQLNGIPYGDYPFVDNEADAVRFAWEARADVVESYKKDIQECMKEGIPVFLTGDFNEPSFLDWTQEAADAGLHKIKVEWPATKAFAEIGMGDAYRTAHPDEVKTPGYTWTPLPGEREVHDRIDFVLFSGCEVTDAFITGEAASTSDVVVSPYPSDHRMVTACFKF